MSDPVLEADHALVDALARADAKAATGLLDDQFNWIDGYGRMLTKQQLAQAKPLLGDESGLAPIVHRYGDVVTVVVKGERQYLLRVWVKRVADEFSLYAATRQLTKAGRVAAIEEQRRTNADSAPSPLVWNEMIDFPNAIVMRCEHQPFHGKATRVSRVFVKRGGQWLMAVSFQTSRQDAPVKTI